jgi:hypothetical protein
VRTHRSTPSHPNIGTYSPHLPSPSQACVWRCISPAGRATLARLSMLFLKQAKSGDTPGKQPKEPNKRKNKEPADDEQLSKKQKGAHITGETFSVLVQGKVRASLKRAGKEGFSVLQFGTGGSETFAKLLVSNAATNDELCEQQKRQKQNSKEVYDLVPHNYKTERAWTFKDADGASCRKVCGVVLWSSLLLLHT